MDINLNYFILECKNSLLMSMQKCIFSFSKFLCEYHMDILYCKMNLSLNLLNFPNLPINNLYFNLQYPKIIFQRH